MFRGCAAALAIVLGLSAASPLACERSCVAAAAVPASTACGHEADRNPDLAFTSAHTCDHQVASMAGVIARGSTPDRLGLVDAPGVRVISCIQSPSSNTPDTSRPPGAPLTVRTAPTLRI